MAVSARTSTPCPVRRLTGTTSDQPGGAFRATLGPGPLLRSRPLEPDAGAAGHPRLAIEPLMRGRPRLFPLGVGLELRDVSEQLVTLVA